MGNNPVTDSNGALESKDIEYNDKTTGDEALGDIDLTNKVAIVTGCNSGIGMDTVRVLAKQNCTVIMACRDIKKAQVAKDEIMDRLKNMQNSETLNSRLIVMYLDLSNLSTIKQFVNDFKDKHLTLNYLINNAGVFGYRSYLLSTDGYELQFAINHLGHFYLTMLLLPNILNMDHKLEPSRVIHVASAMHKDSNNPFGEWVDKQ